MKLLNPITIAPVRLTMKNQIDNTIQTAWFKTVKEANDSINQIEQSGAILGMDYWIQNMPKGQESITRWDPDSVVPGAVYAQETYHPTIATSCIKFYIAENSMGAIMIRTKLLTINYMPPMDSMIHISIQDINPETDMPTRVDSATYIPKGDFLQNRGKAEAEIIRFYISGVSQAVVGPFYSNDEVCDECADEHHHDHCNCGHDHQEQPVLQATSKEEDKKTAGFTITKKEEEEEDDNDPFAYDENELESNQDVQLVD